MEAEVIQDSCQKTSKDGARVTRGQLFKLMVAIDLETINRALVNQHQIRGLSGGQLGTVRDALIQVIEGPDLTDDQITQISELQSPEQASGQLSGFFDKVGDAFKKAGQFTLKILKEAGKAVLKVVTLPFNIPLIVLLKTMKAPVAKMFIYAFIPDGSPILDTNPAVATKREKQLKVINSIADVVVLPRSYILKQIRNAVIKHYRKTPEQVIHDMSGGDPGKPISFSEIQIIDPDSPQAAETIQKVRDLTQSGGTFTNFTLNNPSGVLGLLPELGAISAFLAALAAFIPEVRQLITNPGQVVADPSDWNQKLPGALNVTGDPEYSASSGGDVAYISSPSASPGALDTTRILDFIKSPAGIATGAGLTILVGSFIYILNS